MGIIGHDTLPFFIYQNKQLTYNPIHFQNFSERAVEVPIAIDFLKRIGKEKRILEVGNVLSNYAPLLSQHPEIGEIDVLDKFEKGPGIMNVDLMDFNEKYDAIVSISTVEHIGQNAYGEHSSGDREAPLKAILKIYNLLHPGGKALITVPFGKLMDMGWLIQFSSEYVALLVDKYGIPREALSMSFLKKLDADTSVTICQQVWIQCEERELENTYFQSPFPFANGIAVIELDKVAETRAVIQGRPEPLHYRSPVNIPNYYYTPFYKLFPYDLNGWFVVDQPGLAFYGPFINLPRQVYRFEACIEMKGEGEFTLYIMSDSGKKVLWERRLSKSSVIRDLIYLNHEEKNVEVRLHKHDPTSCTIRIPNMFLSQL
ncbi:hypothetical protein EDM54_18255 [Brevibacillus borstelensis]|jgi:hypothetical protein|uniref:hypothetical protein n=1 Tax=Brevibacillus borstelensis TaxID=45462 RepID=UPI000F08D180|nr:hypothetical protein [Brevibacillus borstelensis]MCM3590612.1 hypothetical protein [Brevibacillus borstelensis]MED1884448.1 hypothetical protein [Brevibacillus borstelensis]RNB61043.1 hypothetical protein EDM54_18255 [Brevibacillus borstelensis]GED52549.1 hypothetical protein BBO01nite_17900 [Brevibacillus borstelensis]